MESLCYLCYNAMKYILFILLLVSCKKEEIKTKDVKAYTLNYTSVSASYKLIQVNGTTITPPTQVKSGDKVYVRFACQPTTPKSYDLIVSILLDGKSIGGCSGCDEYVNTFTMQ